ncbi:hypothetical protein MMC28_010532 [Mycoblastus sanguinarius]|nr:hypothetical protein [Mycoblastus sanguinarius]
MPGQMQNSSADNLPSLSSTCPTNKAIDTSTDNHDPPLKPSNHSSNAPSKYHTKPSISKIADPALQAAKLEIHTKLREDWTWPHTTSTPTLPSSEIEWRERDSDSSFVPSSPNVKPDPYKYDTPDAIEQPQMSRKRKRRELLQEEMTWNEGLRTYTERRDAWAGARTRPHSPSVESPYQRITNSTTSGTSFPHKPPYPMIPPTSDDLLLPPSPPPSPKKLLPIAPPILPPTNHIRASIGPATYPSIYSKIIIQGLAPTVPINLQDVVNALVAGWKKDGEWPPKSEAEKAGNVDGGGEENRANGFSRVGTGGGRRLARKGVGRVKKALGLGRGVDSRGNGGNEGDG